MRNKIFTSIVLAVFVCFQIPSELFAISSPAQVLGQIVSKRARINGVEVSSGTTLLDCSLVETDATPAFIHIPNGSVVEIAGESAVYFQKTESDMLQIEVHRGGLRFQEEEGGTVTIPGAERARRGEAEPGQGLVAVTTRDASVGITALNVNETGRVAPTSPILIVSPDGKRKEIHYVKSVKANTIEMTAGLQIAFPVQSLIYQGDRIDPAVATGTPIIGTVVAGGGKGVSKIAVVLIAVGGGAAAGAAVAFSKSGGDGGGAPPATNVNP